MYSKFFKHADIRMLEQELDDFLKELNEITGQISNIQMLHSKEEVIVLIIYNCWKKL